MRKIIIILFALAISPFISKGQAKDTLIFKGQLSSWLNYNQSNNNILFGGRYIPQVNYSNDFSKGHQFDIELSGNFYGNLQSHSEADGNIKPYRAWTRYSTPQFEIRAGLQKINFGSATMLRPLMWFDQMDPRDPLQLTDGVWGVLGKYYFLNNANIWLWGLYGNKNTKGWDWAATNSNYPEFGGRIQLPTFIGEAAISYHHRVADLSDNDLGIILPTYSKAPENRIGLDAKFDWVIGFWVEGAWINNQKDLLTLTNQTILNAGADYTFGIGNGLLAVYEHLIFSADSDPFAFENTNQFSLFSLSYPMGLFDNVSAMLYYSWDNEKIYSFLNWQRQYNNISLHLMAYWNPETFDLPQQNFQNNIFGGKGVQFMFVFNH